MNDLKYLFRQLTKHPGFTATAVVTLALGLGANTAIFSVLDRALVRELAVPGADRLVHVVTDRGGGSINYNLSFPFARALATETDVFAGVAARTRQRFALAGADGAERVDGAFVSGNFFDVLRLTPAAGRWFFPDEDRIGAPVPVAVISHALWERRFARSTAAIGAS